jgi:hypothetical protein
VLNGVGGRTIAEAKENMLHDEYLDWIAYRNKHGPLNLAKHVEWGNGLLAMLFNNVHYRDKKEHHEFMPHYEMPEATIGDVMKLLSGG